jgi:hypothetical protein
MWILGSKIFCSCPCCIIAGRLIILVAEILRQSQHNCFQKTTVFLFPHRPSLLPRDMFIFYSHLLHPILIITHYDESKQVWSNDQYTNGRHSNNTRRRDPLRFNQTPSQTPSMYPRRATRTFCSNFIIYWLILKMKMD